MATTVKKTYHKRARTIASVSSSPPTPLLPARVSSKRAREEDDGENLHPKKRQNTTVKILSTITNKNKQALPSKKPRRKPLTQLHLALSAQPSLRSCNLCGLSYTRGTPEDESLHRSHCARVTKGMEWGRTEEKESGGVGVSMIRRDVRLKCGEHGRIISFRADASGRIGTKLSTILSTINLALSAPSLTAEALAASKAYLFLVPGSKSTKREHIVGCLIAQRIKTAMDVADNVTVDSLDKPSLVHVDGGLYCRPAPLPTPAGISRVFVARDHRCKGIGHALLDAMSQTFIHACPLDPVKGQIAFSQPTGDGRRLMESWGRGKVRVYEE